jgi:biopolymer transport protein ExbB
VRKLLALALLAAAPCLAGWSYTSTVQVDRTKCGSSNMSNFPVLISISDTRLKTVGNGGLVTSSSGYDIAVATTSSIATYIPWEVEYWNGTTGVWVGWAVLSNVNGSGAGSNTTFGFAIGNSAITTQQNTGSYASTNVYDSNYKMVLHLATSGSSVNLNDSTSNGNNGSVYPTGYGSSLTPITGVIDGGVNYGATGLGYNAQINLSTTGFPTGTQQFTISTWVYNFGSGGARYGFYVGNYSTTNDGVYIFANGAAMEMGTPGSGYSFTSSNAWDYCVFTYDGTSLRMYLNGAQVTGSPQTVTLATTAAGVLGNNGVSGTYFTWAGDADETRVSTGIARSGDWQYSEYENATDPGNISSPGFLIFASVAAASNTFPVLY